MNWLPAVCVNIPQILSACARDVDHPFLVIGGYAVIAHGYARFTYDLDFVVRRSQRDSWVAKLKGLGFTIQRQSELFIQFSPRGAGTDLDLMLVNDETFAGLQTAGRRTEFAGVSARMVSLDHLLALKLHVIKQKIPRRLVKDMDDVIMLVVKNGLNIRTSAYKKLFLKYGDLETYEKACRATKPHKTTG